MKSKVIKGSGTGFPEVFEMLVRLIGEENAWKVCEYLQGEQVTFPKSILVYRRNKDIRSRYKAGATYAEIAHAFGITSRWARIIIHRKIASDGDYGPDSVAPVKILEVLS